MKRMTAPERLLTLARSVLMVVFGTGPDGLTRLIVEIASVPLAEQFVFCANRWIWL
jgi:hypothetical protein